MMLDGTQRFNEPLTERAFVQLARGSFPRGAKRYAPDHGRRMAYRGRGTHAGRFRVRGTRKNSF